MAVSEFGLPLGTLRERQRRAARAGKLDCAFCGLGYEDFHSLAYHVANDCRCTPASSVLTQREQEKAAMAKKVTRNKGKRYASGEVPDAGASADGGRERRPFLRVQDVPSKGATVVFNGDSRVVRGSFGDQWLCGVKVNGKDYNWGIRIGGSVHRAVKALAGKKLRKGLKVEVERREFENDHGEFIKFIAVVED